jgi:hypothetical protein
MKFFAIFVISVSFAFSDPQFGDIQIYQHQYNENPGTSYFQSVPQLKSFGGTNNNINYINNNNNINNQAPVTNYPKNTPQSSSSCNDYFKYENINNEQIGVITIPTPDRQKNVIRVVLSVAVHVSEVS